MDVRDLCYVEAVASTGSHTEAAHRLGVSRQAVAKGIRRVEELADFELFSRQDGRLVPTRRGRSSSLTPRGCSTCATSLPGTISPTRRRTPFLDGRLRNAPPPAHCRERHA